MSGIAVDISVDRRQSWQPAKLDAEIGPLPGAASASGSTPAPPAPWKSWLGPRAEWATAAAGTHVNAAGYHHNVPQVVKVEVA
ncbi:MAG: hypothetical protein H7A15_06715 [Sinobacteraceae bacterium]|nr:hypothetical protein [Nevskiaceae bacterium]